MEKRKLGRTELEVSVVGFGAMTIGGIFGPVDDAVSNKALHASIDAGMNFIDSSIGYGDGKSEEVIGRFLKERKDRDQIVICTKGGSNMSTGERSYAPDYVQKCAEGSLRRLGVETIDVYLLHNPALENMKAADSFDLLEKYKEQGKIKCWGVSVNTVEECEYAVSNGRPDVFQMEYNIFLQEPAAVFADGKRENIGVISRVPLKRGLFSERVTEKTLYSEDDRRKGHLGPENLPALLKQRGKIEEVAKSLGCSLAELAIRFCVSNPDVATVIPGIRTPEQAKENAAASELLPEEILEKLRRIS